MTGGVDPKFEAELRRGVVQLVALHFLETPRYGYDLVRLLGAAGFAIEEGTLYPILRRFEKQGVLTSRWDTEGARPRKYYELSDDGRLRMNGMLKAWGEARDATDEALRQALVGTDPASADKGPDADDPATADPAIDAAPADPEEKVP